MPKIDIKNLSRQELEESLESLGEKRYRARQVMRWLYKTGVKHFNDMTDIPVELRRQLNAQFHITRPVLLDSRRSVSDGTTKYLLKMEDSNTIETVFLPESRRNTICLSSQVGCKFACAFCASGPFGFVRNLKASEILDEVLFVRSQNSSRQITNLVFMGIGEPLDNYDNVIRAIKILNDPDGFNIGSRKMTISTCGIIPGIRRLRDEGLQIELSVSLHSADDKTRSRLVPVNKKYPLKDLIKTCEDYTRSTGRIVTFEYVLIKGVNSSKDDAVRLARLLKGLKCKVNTITCNIVAAKGCEIPDAKAIKIFIETLRLYGIASTHRKSRGEDIEAGCGQLRIARL